jgi:hypothetical protein
MNPFDDAVNALLSSAPDPTPLERLRARINRRRRSRAIAIIATTTVVLAGSVGVAASLGRDKAGPAVTVSPTTPLTTTSSTTPADNPWCVAFLREKAIARGHDYGVAIIDAPRVRVKLVSLAELLAGTNDPLATNDPQTHLRDHKTFWVVELLPSSASQSPYKWGLVAIDADSGAIVTENSGPSTGPSGTIDEPSVEPPYWGALPDHSAACPLGKKLPESTSTTFTTPATGSSTGTSLEMGEAVDAWATFPVNASPRPIVLTSDPVSAPDTGFATDDAKEAFASGAFVAPRAYPTGPTESDGLPVASAADAFTTMRNEGTPASGAPTPPTPLVVTNVRFGTASFGTDRGTRSLPAWMFSFAGVQDPAAVLAVAPSATFHEPADTSTIGARLGTDGRHVIITFVGAKAGTGPCTADYTVDQFASDTAVAVKVRETRDGGGACTDIGYTRRVEIALDSPLGNRVLVDAKTKAAVPLTP